MEKELNLDLGRLAKLFLHMLWLFVITAILGGAAGYFFSKNILKPTYRSQISMYVRTDSNREHSDYISKSDMDTAKSLVATYIAVLNDEIVMNRVGEKLVQEYGEEQASAYFQKTESGLPTFLEPESIRSCFHMEAVEKTELLRISSVTADPYLSKFLCQTIADIAPDYLIRVVGAGSIEVIGPATLKLTKISPNNTKAALIGVVLGILSVSGLILLLDVMNNTIRDKESLLRQFEKPVLGEIQHYSKKQEIPFRVQEAYRLLRTNLFYALSTGKRKVIAISSPNPEEGKTTTTLHLAKIMAQTGKQILLIDADLRKPMLHKLLNLSNRNGISDLLGQMTALEKGVHENVLDHLDVITSGPIPPNPSELLGSANMKELLNTLESQYDYILIDTPPLNAISDALCLRDSIGGLCLVVQHKATKNIEIAEACRKLSYSEIPLLGFVLNNIQMKGSREYSKYMSGYISPSDTEKKKKDRKQKMKKEKKVKVYL